MMFLIEAAISFVVGLGIGWSAHVVTRSRQEQE